MLRGIDKVGLKEGRDSSGQCMVPCCVSHLSQLTKWPPSAHSVDTHPHEGPVTFNPSDSLEATSNKLLRLLRGYSSCLVDRLLMSLVSRRPFPAGDRVTFNGKDCLCQYCVEPMSPGPKDILGSSSKWILSTSPMYTGLNEMK